MPSRMSSNKHFAGIVHKWEVDEVPGHRLNALDRVRRRENTQRLEIRVISDFRPVRADIEGAPVTSGSWDHRLRRESVIQIIAVVGTVDGTNNGFSNR